MIEVHVDLTWLTKTYQCFAQQRDDLILGQSNIRLKSTGCTLDAEQEYIREVTALMQM